MEQKTKRIMKIRSLLVTLLVALMAVVPAGAQNARKILDQTSSKLQSCGGISATFAATSFKNNAASGATSGNIYIQGNKFKMSSGYGTTWFNGTTQWALTNGSDEVYISTPTAAELQSINPYTFVNLYKSGYTLSVKDATYNGKSCHEVKMKANSKKSIKEMLVTIDKTTHLPLCVRLLQSNGIWIRIQVSNISTGKSWNSSFFEFSQKDYPNVEIVDLR